MNPTKLIKQLRDELQSLCHAVRSLEIEGTHIFVDAALIAEADAHLKSGGWVPMKSAPKNVTVLLCVPTRCNKRQRYVIAQGEWFGSYWAIPNADEAIQQVTPVAWQPLPQPPEQTMNTVVQEHWNGDEDMARGHAAITAEMSAEVDAREAWIKEADRLAFGSNGNHLLARSDRDKYDIVFSALISHLRTTPEGYVLVPVKLTEPLLIAGRDSVTLEHGVDAMLKYAWSQIIDAAQEGK